MRNCVCALCLPARCQCFAKALGWIGSSVACECPGGLGSQITSQGFAGRCHGDCGHATGLLECLLSDLCYFMGSASVNIAVPVAFSLYARLLAGLFTRLMACLVAGWLA